MEKGHNHCCWILATALRGGETNAYLNWNQSCDWSKSCQKYHEGKQWITGDLLLVTHEQQVLIKEREGETGLGEEKGTIITSLWLFEVASGLFPRYSKYRLSACLLASRHSKATFMEALPPSQRAIGSTGYPSLLTQCCVNPGKMTSICPKRVKDEDAAPAHRVSW